MSKCNTCKFQSKIYDHLIQKWIGLGHCSVAIPKTNICSEYIEDKSRIKKR